MKKTIKYFFFGFFGLILFGVIGFILFFKFRVSIDIPEHKDLTLIQQKRIQADSNFYFVGNNWIRKNKYGIWEMYLEGNGFERGVAHGILAKEMVINQEDLFVGQIKQLIPSETYLKFLKYFILWFNRDIDDYIPDEFKDEIYGVSFSASEDYGYIGSKYERILNYHAAHDIGHALQDKNMVPGCTSFAAWDSKTIDSSLYLGRNFDFFVGEGFAEDKIVCFINPDSGYKLMYVTWAGFTGVVSGMNEKGLTVTLNASKSDVPVAAATPISVLAREILQYASTIDEAYAIAQKRKTFVSEAIMIGSALDHRTAIIEIAPSKIGLFESGKNEIKCSNHFQGKIFSGEQDIKEQSSVYRYNRLTELLNAESKLEEKSIAAILRNRYGLNDESIGLGNEKALNQLIAHHAVIFNATKKHMWVTANPYQLGAFVGYDIEEVFKTKRGLKTSMDIHTEALTIPRDTFLLSKEFNSFLKFKEYRNVLVKAKQSKIQPLFKTPFNPDEFIATNPDFYYTYWLLGDYYKFALKDFATATKYYQIALTKEVPRENEIAYLKESIESCKNK